ncbi:hypothetical protein DDZ13_01385 [Coraliomargarita sinensis]|uniref:Glycosyltransferase RgtA/B/C/D-like domain-containing protein n=2 Tax=Coraliomargarita sinensis TaxID=2174842 RepID=A0A317ZMT3_9BACT|nr:hypothetical protein DDZ13_01385 [Coraliomargarita sinensis]
MIALLALGIIGSLYAFWGASPETAVWIVNKTGYYFAVIITLLFGYSVLRIVRFEIPKGPHLIYLSGGVLLAVYVVFLHGELGPKIAMDDYTLSSTAKSLSMEREVEVLTQGRNFNEYFIRVDSHVDKRPWLYPFAVSVVHDLTGYRLINGFLVNAGFAIILLALTALFGYRVGGLPVGILGPFLWASLPLLSQNATGGGLDMLNLLMLFVVILCGIYYIEKPERGRLNMLVLGMVLLSYTRYESVLFWLPVLIVVAIGWLREKQVILSYGFSAAPALLFGLAALLNHNYNNPRFWELPNAELSRFSSEYLIPNLYGAFYFFLNPGDELANSFLLGLAGIPFLVLFILRSVDKIKKHQSDRFQATALLIFGIGIVGHFIFIMAFYHGQLDNRITSRFSLPLYLLFVVSIVVVLAKRPPWRPTWWVVSIIVIVSMLGFTLPNKAKGIYSKSNFVVRETEWLMKHADRLFKPKSLVVDTNAIIWTLYEWHSINPSEAVSNRGRLSRERARRKLPEIYWIERSRAVFDEDKKVTFKPNYHAEGFEKILIAEKSFSPLRITRIYRVGTIEGELSEAKVPFGNDTKGQDGEQSYQKVTEGLGTIE